MLSYFGKAGIRHEVHSVKVFYGPRGSWNSPQAIFTGEDALRQALGFVRANANSMSFGRGYNDFSIDFGVGRTSPDEIARILARNDAWAREQDYRRDCVCRYVDPQAHRQPWSDPVYHAGRWADGSVG